VKNHKIAKNLTATKAREKIRGPENLALGQTVFFWPKTVVNRHVKNEKIKKLIKENEKTSYKS
jgi:hypothetical protein